MKFIFCFLNVLNSKYIQEMEQKIEKKLFVFKTIAFEAGVANCHNPEQDTCHRQSMC